MKILYLCFITAVLLCPGSALPAQEPPASPLSPKDALKAFKVAEGFRIDLVAAEPDVMDPVAMAFDENGRIYVAEMGDYPLGPPGGRIKLLEDTDGDGRLDRAILFADKVPYVNGVLPWKGGLLVTAAPDILYLKDTDGDGKADVREVVFTGFVEGNQQHRANGLQFAIDNWIYGANGDSGGNLRPANPPDAKRVSIRGTDFRFRTDFTGLEPVAGQSQFANTFDDWGNRYINNNSNHIIFPVLPLRYLGRNPNLAVSGVTDNIPDHGAAAQIYPTSRIEARFNDYNAAGHFTSACAVTIYRGDAFPAEFRGNAFVCEPVHNLVHRDLLVPRGASFVAKRAYEKGEFLTSTDNWCRPVNLQTGPDGCLYVVDMYRAVIEHPQWIPLETQKRVDLRAGHDRGRIYRISPEGMKPAARPRLGAASIDELVACLEKPNGWWRSTAQRLLVERQDKAAVEPLRRLARHSASALGRVHALWTLEGLSALSAELVEGALRNAEAGMREHALRLAEPRLAESDALRQAILALADDPSPRVRFQLAFTLGEMKDERALDALARIVVRDVEDRWVPVACLSSVKGSPQKLLARIRGASPDFLEKPPPASLQLIRQLADLVGAGRDENDVVEWLQLLAADAGPQPARWRLVALSALGPSLRRWGVGLDSLLKKSGTEKQVGEWSARLIETAADGAREVAERVSAIDLLALLPTADVGPRLERLLRPQEPQEVQVAVIRALSDAPGDPVGTRLLDGWVTYTAPVRREILRSLFARPAQIGRVLDRLEKGEIRVVELETQHREQLLKHSSGAVRERARKLLEARASGETKQLIEEMRAKVFTLKGDRVQGEKVYMSNCATCHRLHGQGFQVGANLESVAGRDRLALLTDILDPNRAIDPQYQQYVVKTSSGETLSGIISAETPGSLTLRRANAEQSTVLRRDIAEIKAWPASLMPEGVEKNITPQGFADLLAFLGATSAAPARKVFDGNKPELVKPGSDGSLKLLASQSEIYGSTIIFEAPYKNLGYWSSESDQAVWSLEVAKAGKYAVELDWACEDAAAGNSFAIDMGEGRLAGKVAGTGSWDTYKQARIGTLQLPAGAQKLVFHSVGPIKGALIDLRSIRLLPE